MDIVTRFIPSTDASIKVILELGSRDLKDAIKLQNHFNCQVYAFECNPECLKLCEETVKNTTGDVFKTGKIILIPKAVYTENTQVTFRSIDTDKYSNCGASSLFKLTFNGRNENDPDRHRHDVQKEVKVDGIRLDTFAEQYKVDQIDLIWMDLQGYELAALQSLGSKLKNVKFIYTEVTFTSTYENGVSFGQLSDFLKENGFRYVFSDSFGFETPTFTTGFFEFNVLFQNLEQNGN